MLEESSCPELEVARSRARDDGRSTGRYGCALPATVNGRLRTGADKGNPTV